MKKLYIKFNEENQAVFYPYFPQDGKTLEEFCEENLKEGEYVLTDEVFSDISLFPEAFKIINGKITIDYETAKELQRNKWRLARKPLLEKLDVEFMRALENGDILAQKAIVEKKQELRDITKTPMINDLNSILLTWPNPLKSL